MTSCGLLDFFYYQNNGGVARFACPIYIFFIKSTKWQLINYSVFQTLNLNQPLKIQVILHREWDHEFRSIQLGHSVDLCHSVRQYHGSYY